MQLPHTDLIQLQLQYFMILFIIIYCRTKQLFSKDNWMRDGFMNIYLYRCTNNTNKIVLLIMFVTHKCYN